MNNYSQSYGLAQLVFLAAGSACIGTAANSDLVGIGSFLLTSAVVGSVDTAGRAICELLEQIKTCLEGK